MNDPIDSPETVYIRGEDMEFDLTPKGLLMLLRQRMDVSEEPPITEIWTRLKKLLDEPIEWVSFEDGSPPEDRPVRLHYRLHTVTLTVESTDVVEWDEEAEMWLLDDIPLVHPDDLADLEVLHWHPLPEPPETDG